MKYLVISRSLYDYCPINVLLNPLMGNSHNGLLSYCAVSPLKKKVK